MPFTGLPGTPDSRPGNVIPGLGAAGNSLDEPVSQTLTLSQSVSVEKILNLHPTSTLSLTQRAGQAFPVNASNTLSLTQNANDGFLGNTEITSTLVLTQSATYTKVYSREVEHFLVMGTDAVGNQTFNREVNHTLTFISIGQKVIDESVPQTLALTQTVSVVKVKRAGIVQPLVLTQEADVSADYGRSVSQGLALSQVATKTISRVLGASNSLALAQSAVGIATKLAANTLTLTQDASVVLVKKGTNTLVLTQTVSENHTVSKRMYDVLPVFHTIVLSKTLRRTVAQSLTLTQSVSADVVRPTSSHLLLEQMVVCDKVKPGFSTVLLSHVALCNKTVHKPVTQSLTLTQSVTVSKSVGRSVTQTLAFEQHARGTRVHNVSASNALVLTQQMYRDLHVESVTTPLVLTQTVEAPKIAPRAVAQSLTLTHSVSVAKTLLRSVEHTVVFQTSFEKQIGLPGQPTVSVPEVQAVRVRSLVILESGTGVIVLPAPEFNDKEGGNGKINIKRAMDGTRRVYKRDQPSSRLIYDFIMDRKKAIELRAFIMTYNSSVIRMTNWKGEIWYVVLTNNPFQFTEDARWDSDWGNKCSVTLEFQGVKVN